MAFKEISKNGLVYMNSEVIGMRHAFTTRIGGVSSGPLESLNLGFNRGDKTENVLENYRRLCGIFGTGINDCAVTAQVHGKEVRIVSGADKHVWGTDIPYEADGIVTAERGMPIFCFAADCIPVLLCDDKAKVAGAVHCGWRSSVADILSVAVEKMESLGADRKNIRAALGPAIGACCFETDNDVVEAVETYLKGDTDGLFVPKAGGKTLVDLRGANARRLLQLGLEASNIDVSEECTYCSNRKYWSHRFSKGVRGTQGAVIIID